MKFKEIQCNDSNTQRVYNNYIKTIENVTKSLTKVDRQEIVMEFNSHKDLDSFSDFHKK